MQDELISRRAVKDKLLKFCNELEGIFANIRMENQDESVCGLCEYDCPAPYECPGFDNEDCFKLADEIRHKWQSTKDLPPVNSQPKTGWIPVSERLPEDEQEILFSTKTGSVHSGKYHDDDSANQWYSHKDKCRAWNNVVTAWMPLPKKYEPQESEVSE